VTVSHPSVCSIKSATVDSTVQIIMSLGKNANIILQYFAGHSENGDVPARGKIAGAETVNHKLMSRESGGKTGPPLNNWQALTCNKYHCPGQIFLRMMIDQAHRGKQLDHWVHLNQPGLHI
jgi:hypothetical protein